MTTALFVGDLTLDLTMRIDHVPAPDEKVHVDDCLEAVGGVVANSAMACLRSCGAARLIVQTGPDRAAGLAIADLRQQGLAVEASVIDGRTARVVILIEPHGEKRLLLDPGVSIYPNPDAVARADLGEVGWMHTAVYGDAAWPLVARCRAAEIPVSLDLEPATFPDGIDTLAALIPGAVLFCNNRAATAIGPRAEDRLLDYGAAAVVRTLGPAGARLVTRHGSFEAPAPALPAAVDTTGAGDCLAGWFVGERLAGQSPERALRRAVAAATLSCQRSGGQTSYPTAAEVDALVAVSTPSSDRETR